MIKIIFSLLATLCVHMTVYADAKLQITSDNSVSQVQPLDYGSYWFGRVQVNSRNSVRYTVTNTGDEPLDFMSANIWGMYFDAYHNCNRTLQPTEQCQFEIIYWPHFEGHHTGDFDLQFKQDSVQIHVWGEAAKPF